MLDTIPTNVWREVYQERWTELRKVQKAEWILEALIFGSFIGGCVYFASASERGPVGFLLLFGAVGFTLAVFFWLLTRSIK